MTRDGMYRRIQSCRRGALMWIACACIPSSAALAQHTRSFDLSTGITRVQRDVYNDRHGPALDALLALPLAGGPLRLGIGVTAHASVKTDDSCIVSAGSNTCRNDMPFVGGLVTSLGAELVPSHTSSRWSVRLFAGAGVFRVSDDRASLYAGGASGRIDVGLPIAGHVTMVLSGRTTYLPAMPADGLGFQSLSLGVRVQ